MISMPAHLSPRVAKLLSQATPDKVRYIKLGENNKWWQLAKHTSRSDVSSSSALVNILADVIVSKSRLC
jgi:hypothetical protein